MSGTRYVLSLNGGSSSLKFALFAAHGSVNQEPILSGQIGRIGEASSEARLFRQGAPVNDTHCPAAITDHGAALRQVLAWVECDFLAPATRQALTGVAHRVVHGGTRYTTAQVIDEAVIKGVEACTALAPLHNPINLELIRSVREALPTVPQVAVFDTAFFHDLPAHAAQYALPAELVARFGIRRFGFHGISHQYVCRQASARLGLPDRPARLISLHLGSGSSIAAVRGERCVDTSMGMTPLEGLVMGTRCGDIDPGVALYLAQQSKLSVEKIDHLLNHESGLKGLCGSADMREVRSRATNGDADAQQALALYRYRMTKYIGAYFLALGGVDALIFTGGIGEHDTRLRAEVVESLSPLGIRLDAAKNTQSGQAMIEIHSPDSTAKILVIPTREEWEIARQSLAALDQKNQ